MKTIRLVSAFAFLLAGSLCAQQETSHFSFSLGGGFTQPVGNTGRHLEEGWNVQGAGGYNFSSHIGALVQLDYNSFGINGSTLNRIGFPDGGVHIFSATLNPIVHLTPHSHGDVYLIGGGGLYHVNQQFTQPSTATLTAFDPFFGGFYPVTVPTTQILSSYTINKPGVNFGAGIAVGTKWHGKVFAEARYDRIFLTSNRHMDYIPVAFGFRW